MARSGFLLFEYFVPLVFFLNYCTAIELTEVKIHILPVYAMLTNADLLNSTKCGKELTDFREAIDQHLFWSLKG
ncbi:hypothetical protein M0802_014698 [Mischocyttarus mexicanus]|nr:hypothetical protein M0802_014698 [Mischocyttarus mexicanus]